MFQPNRKQWSVIWVVALTIVLGWPTASGTSLGLKALHFLADPFGHVPSMPPPLPMGLGDDGDAVMAHDALEQEYFTAYDSGPMTRFRMRIEAWQDPLAPTTQRQILIALAVVGALLVWALDDARKRRAEVRRGADQGS